MMMKLNANTMWFFIFTVLVTPSIFGLERSPSSSKETVVLERVNLPGTIYEMGMGIAEFPPFASKPLHSANGPEVCYVLKGEVFVEVDGRPLQKVSEGQSYQMPANVAHVTRAGANGAKVLASWIWVPGTNFNIKK